MRLALTYNVKKSEDAANPHQERVSQGVASQSVIAVSSVEYIDDNLMNNYPERIDDTYAEWDSMETINAVKTALENSGHEVVLIEGNDEAYIKLKNENPDFVFNVAEGFYGPSRESQIPAMLEMLNIPFTGSDSISIGICHDKSRCKEILSYYGVPTPAFFITDKAIEAKAGMKFPKFVKPLHEGSSKGIYNSSLAKNIDELNSEILRIKTKYNQPALVEDYAGGKEFTVAMLGNGENLKALPIVEINLAVVPENFNKIYSYEVKWFFDTRENQLDIFKCPAEVEPLLYSKIEQICKDAFRVLRLRDWARIDVRLDDSGEPTIIEINPLPGILPDPKDNSCYPKSGRAAGMDYNALINAVFNTAVERVNNNGFYENN